MLNLLFSLFWIRLARAQIFVKKFPAVHQQEPPGSRFSLNEVSVLVGIAAAVAIAGAGCGRSGHDGCADIRVGLHGRAHLIDFIER
jgi:hypothetical protein